ncbi:2-dehydropantoate 2-reductase [Lactobacillus sp. ESL0703]|uniref:2-dehydropantoate 2-reductase n=1 Tax=Lactobacillus sp. ESL0703 TaxID=2983218 RepID=UPI0023F6AFFC|nr:2-dehydropantoate 2-reductase [Lactobacillus sp. ESL0703]MDF7668846.1 2-dehydropantoate 2-reductase [Lactobacillus sp. ESL0703]
MKIVIAGSGAMGLRFGLLLKRGGNDVTLVDGWDKNIAAVRENGVKADVDGETLTATMPIYKQNEIAEEVNNVDLVIVFTKSMALGSMLDSVKSVIGPNTYILCLLNGLGHEEVLEQYVAKDHIIMGVTMNAASMPAPGETKFDGSGPTELQCLAASGQQEVQKIVDVFNESKIEALYSENVLYSIWRKACVNGVVNSVCALLEGTTVDFGHAQNADAITRTIVDEFADVAEREGVYLDRKEVVEHVESTWTMDHYPSMYQDLVVNHRPTEIDYINGAVWRKGQKYGVPTPYCACITNLVHAKEGMLNVK